MNRYFSVIALMLILPKVYAGGGAAASDSDLVWIFFLLILIISLPIAIPFIRKKFKKRIEVKE